MICHGICFSLKCPSSNVPQSGSRKCSTITCWVNNASAFIWGVKVRRPISPNLAFSQVSAPVALSENRRVFPGVKDSISAFEDKGINVNSAISFVETCRVASSPIPL